ncbi:MAG: lytic murein transglycosylase B [Gammaproteobacteria bacterium]|nr:lytic murein transglycosylase B [Gammaproteobacteria bacterium]
MPKPSPATTSASPTNPLLPRRLLPFPGSLFNFAWLLPLIILTLPLRIDAAPQSSIAREDVLQFIDEMVNRHQFDAEQLQQLFSQARYQQKIIDAISRPAEGKDWYQYRPIFLNQKRITEGVAFLRQQRETLQRAEEKFGVPPEIITAIIGVETRYGQHSGSYRVIDALSTLAFAYPKRAPFFRKQLEQYLLMAREEQLQPLQLKGSYAGAMGMPQFIPGSFREYAIDFDGNGHRDLWQSVEDVIGSVANYFKRHQWRQGGAVAVRAKVADNLHLPLLEKGYQPSIPVNQLQRFGVIPTWTIPPKGEDVALIALKQQQGEEHWVVFDNFYVITRYNHSPLYAMAVFQLSEAIRSAATLTVVQ